MWDAFPSILERALRDRSETCDLADSATDRRQQYPRDDRPILDAVVIETSRGQRLVLTERDGGERDPTGETRLSAAPADLVEVRR